MTVGAKHAQVGWFVIVGVTIGVVDLKGYSLRDRVYFGPPAHLTFVIGFFEEVVTNDVAQLSLLTRNADPLAF